MTAPAVAGLTQTLNEFRQTTHQLQKLQSHELRRLQAVEKGSGSGAGSAGTLTPPGPASLSGAPAEPLPQQNGTGHAASDSAVSAGSSPKAASSTGGEALRRSPRGPAPASIAAAAGAVAAAEMSAEAAEATRIAEQLEDVAGGAESGLLADAAAALRELSMRDAKLVGVQQVSGAGQGQAGVAEEQRTQGLIVQVYYQALCGRSMLSVEAQIFCRTAA